MPTATESNLIWGTGPSSEVHWNSRLYEPFKNNFQAYLVLLFHIFFYNISAIKYHQTLSYRDQKLLMKKFWTILLESELETSKARSRNPLKVNAKEKEKGVLPIPQGRLPWPSHSTINSELLRRGSAQQPMSHFLLRSRR